MLLRACRARIEETPKEDRQGLAEVERKIARAKRFADEARKRKERLGLGR